MGSSVGPAGINAAARRRGSTFTDRQIAQTVKDGKAIQVTLPDGSLRTGWVYGTDDYHWGIVSQEGTVSIVHKTAPCLEVLDDLVLSDQPEGVRVLVEPLVSPHRNYVMRTHFHSAVPAT